MLWDAAEPLTVARVMSKGNVYVLGGFGVTADQEACNALRKNLTSPGQLNWLTQLNLEKKSGLDQQNPPLL